MRIAALVLLPALLSAGAWAQQPADPGRTILLIIDDLHLDFRMTPRTRELLTRLIAGAVRDGDLVGIISTGHSSISERFTSDPKVVQSAIERMTGGGLRPTELVGPTAPPNRDVEVRSRIHSTLTTTFDALRSLERARPGPRVVIFVSSGFQLPVDPDLTRELQEVSRVATLANASIYALWPRGFIDASFLQAPDTDEWRRYVRESQDMLRTLTSQTGGLTIVDPPGFEAALNAIR